MINKLDHYGINIHEVIDKINEIIDFLNDTYLMKVKDGQYGTLTDSCTLGTNYIAELNESLTILGGCVEHIGLKSNIKCPHCGASYYMEGSSRTTLANYPPIWKDGINVNRDYNKTTTHYTCLSCGKEFDIQGE